jgi:hypothetical protein
MPMTNTEALEAARTQARETLAMSQAFVSLPVQEQFRIYRETVDGLARDFANGGPRSQAMAPPVAGDLIDDKRHLNQRIEQAGDLAGDFVQAVNFPQFVKDLLKGVFDANLAVTLQQMEAYQTLLKAATKSIGEFINKIDNTAAFGYLAEHNSDEFSIDFDDGEQAEDNPQGAVLTDKEGTRLDIGDNEVKAKIMDAKIAMAREQRAMLREAILMGITRLVVQKGNVKAGVIFDFKASEKIQKADKAATKHSQSSSRSIAASGGILGSIFGGPSGGRTFSDQQAQITVASAKSQADTSLAAKLTGSVDITFISDYFKLDNFAQMYGPQPGVAPGSGAPLAGAGGAPAPGAAAPAPAAPPAPAIPAPAGR